MEKLKRIMYYLCQKEHLVSLTKRKRKNGNGWEKKKK